MDRRKFLTRSLYAGSAVMTAGLGVPAVVTLISPTLRDEGTEAWTRVGKIESFPLNSTKGAVIQVERDDWARSLRTQLLYVRRSAEGDVEAFSRNCTDLSCPVAWDSGSETFLCPCHGGIFNREGEPIAGPPNRALFRYNHRVRDGYLEVDANSIPPIG